MRVGDTALGMQIHDDEIWPRLEEAWRKQIGSGAQASPEIYRAALSDVLRSFVNDKREGATLALRQFAQNHPYDDVRDRLAQSAMGVAVVSRKLGERTLGGAEQRMVDQAKAEGQAQARMGFLVALLVSLIYVLVYVLDRTPAKLSWNEIPETVSASVGWRDPWLDDPAASALVAGAWRVEQSRKREEFDDKQWFVALRTQGCQHALDDASQAGVSVAQAVAQQLGVVPLESARLQTLNHGFNQYIATVYYSVAPVEPLRAGSSEAATDITHAHAGSATDATAVANHEPALARAWLETAQLVVPDGLSALSVVMAHYVVSEQAPDAELMVARATHSIAGRTLLCKAPTIWGWWFDRDRYLE